ncbi:MAG: ABC transporter substrate-binding protein [Myxococcota bacterium]
MNHVRTRAALPGFVLAALLIAGCRPDRDPHEIRLGYAPNLTHVQALVALARGDFENALPPPARLRATPFNAGPAMIEALFAGELDLAYVGPVPAINGFVQSAGRALVIVSGSASGGSALVVRKGAGIDDEKGLAARGVAVPQFGGTQDVALRTYLADRGLLTSERGGSVRVLAVPNPEALTLFRQGQLDAAMVPEPWIARIVAEAGGRVFLDERALWPGGRFATTVLVARREFLAAQPETVRNFLEAHVRVTDWVRDNPDAALALVRKQVAAVLGRSLPEGTVRAGLARVEPLVDPLPDSIRTNAGNARALGYLKRPPALAGLVDLTLLNGVLRGMGREQVSAGALGPPGARRVQAGAGAAASG